MVARSELSTTMRESFNQLVGFQVSSPTLRQQTDTLAGSSLDSNGGCMEQQQQRIGSSLNDRPSSNHSGITFAAAATWRADSQQHFSTESNAGSVVSPLRSSVSMPATPSPPVSRPVSMLSRQIGKSLKRISNQLKRISTSMSAAQQQPDSSHKGGGGGQKEDGSVAKQVPRPEDPAGGHNTNTHREAALPPPAVYLHPTAPLWQAGCEYEATSVADTGLHYPAAAPVPEPPHHPPAAAPAIPSAPALDLRYPAPATAAIVDAVAPPSSVEPAWLSPPTERGAVMFDSARSPSFR